MTLADFKKAKKLSLGGLAELLDLSLGFTSDLVNGKRSCSLEVAVRIEEATNGKVSCRDLLVDAPAR